MPSTSGEPRVVHYNPQVPSSSLSFVAWPAPFSQSQASKSVYSEHLCVGKTKTANRVFQGKKHSFEAYDWLKGAGHATIGRVAWLASLHCLSCSFYYITHTVQAFVL